MGIPPFWGQEVEMDEGRRNRLRELASALQSIQEQVHDLWIEEEHALEDRSTPSKETAWAEASEAVHHVGEAAVLLQVAIDHVHHAVGPGSN
jgi:hypothetical protein